MEKKKSLLPVVSLMAGLLLMAVVGNGLSFQTRNIYIDPVSSGLSISRSAFASAYSVVALAVTPITANVGVIKKKLGSYRMLILVGFVLSGVGLLIASFGQALWSFYLYAFLIQLGVYFCSIVSLTGLVSNWFEKNRGLLVGLLGSGSSLGASFFSPLTGQWITDYGWRRSYLISGIAVLSVAAVVVALIRDYPKGGEPLSRIPDKHELKKEKQPPFWKSRSLMFLGIASFFMMFSMQGFQLNASVILLDSGCDLLTASTVVGRMMFVSILGKIGAGFLNDKLGLGFTRTFLIICSIGGVFSMMFAGHVFAQWCFVILFGIGFSLMLMGLPLHATALFPPNRLDHVIGIVSAFGAAGTFLGVPMVNLYYEWFGNYTGITVISMALLVVAWVFYSLTRPERDAEPGTAPLPIRPESSPERG